MLEFWGIRGTAPVSGKNKSLYGGRTICSCLRIAPDEIIILDAGTGIMELGNNLSSSINGNPLKVHLLLTHFHLDHIIGLPFFSPLFSHETQITFYSPISELETENILQDLMKGRFFPLDFTDTPSTRTFKQLPKDGFMIGDVGISWCNLHHPQGSVAYRIDQDEQSIVMATDTEHPETGVDENLARLCQDADILVYDAMYTPEDYPTFKGWGHSTWLAGTELAKAAGIKSLYLSHLNPAYKDGQITFILKRAQQNFRSSVIPVEEE
ncbi:MAG: MBL fold metallo-hydrolase [Candidatus Aminicenantes bacterium]|nr:MBL fold metallo-hydrolase [Candidatus Aminicenantes bacterium]